MTKLIPASPEETEKVLIAAKVLFALNRLVLHPLGYAIATSYPDEGPHNLPTHLILMKTDDGSPLVFEEGPFLDQCNADLARFVENVRPPNRGVFDSILSHKACFVVFQERAFGPEAPPETKALVEQAAKVMEKIRLGVRFDDPYDSILDDGTEDDDVAYEAARARLEADGVDVEAFLVRLRKFLALHRQVEPPTDEDRKVMAEAGGIAVQDLPFGAAEASRDIRLRDDDPVHPDPDEPTPPEFSKEFMSTNKIYRECEHRLSTGPGAGKSTFTTPCAQCDARIRS